MKEPKVVVVKAASPINPKEIPETVGMLLAESLLKDLQRAYKDPAIQADYQRWKAENAERLAEPHPHRRRSSQSKK